MRLFSLLLVALLAGGLSACSAEPLTPTAAVVIVTDRPTAPARATEGAAEGAPSPAAGLTPVPAPLPWANFGLSGRLVYLTYAGDAPPQQVLAELDLASGQQRVLFQQPKQTWIAGAAISPDGTQVALAYAPPPPEGEPQLGYADLYLLAGECLGQPQGCAPDALQPLLQRSIPGEGFVNPTWSAGGRTLYYVHFRPDRAGANYVYQLERLALPGGQPEVLTENALWPRLSPDGSKLAYVTFNPQDYTNELYVSGADGKDPVRVVSSDMFMAVDAPLFSPDGAQLLFTAVDESAYSPALSWLDRLLGVKVASAHSVPSDWWRIPAGGGQPERLTELADSGLYGEFSPDGQHIAFVSSTGLYVMKPDGSDLTQMLSIYTGGTLAWIP